MIPDTEFVYPKCIFEDMFDNGITKIFNNRVEYYNDPNNYCLKKLHWEMYIIVMIYCIHKEEAFSFQNE